MIYTDSRYANGTITKAIDSRTKSFTIAVFRQFPKKTVNITYYVWKDGDRIESVADFFLNNGNQWHVIMDVNPEILNPFDIEVGTRIRIPRE